MQVLWGALEDLPREEPPMFFHENLMNRIAQEEIRAQEAVAQRRALWDWRALFRPRALAYGTTALVLMLLLAETVQTTRAQLGPLSWIVQILRPAQIVELKAQTLRADWNAEALTLEVRPEPSASRAPIRYELTQQGQSTPLQQGELPADGVIRLPMATPPAPGTLRLRLIRGQAEWNMTVPVTVSPKVAP
jgi:hypothetical protein